MKLCKDCCYFSGSIFCKAPQNGISPIDGSPNVIFVNISRGKRNMCSTDAKYWQQKEVPKVKTLWQKFRQFWTMEYDK